MLYAILCYNDEDTVWSWSQEEDAAVMARLTQVQDRLIAQGKMGPSLRLHKRKACFTASCSNRPVLWLISTLFRRCRGLCSRLSPSPC